MGLRKYGQGEVTGTEGDNLRTTAKQDWSPEDDQKLAAESVAVEDDEE